MLQTAIVLLLAHVLSDFVLQTDWIHENKRSIVVLGLHALIVLVTTVLVAGSLALIPLAIVVASHFLIDHLKSTVLGSSFAAFVIDQSAHVVIIGALAFNFPNMFSDGWWPAFAAANADLFNVETYLSVCVIAAGFITATRAGQFGVALFMDGFAVTSNESPTLERGGAAIGVLERALVFIFVLAGRPEAIGFLIAAKSVLRFNVSKNDRAASEYVIIGTLASFAWGLLAALATQAALNAL